MESADVYSRTVFLNDDCCDSIQGRQHNGTYGTGRVGYWGISKTLPESEGVRAADRLEYRKKR